MLDAAPQDTETLLDVNNIEVIYDHVILVLKGVSLQVPKGGITALLGGNGAGKTTTLKAISNLLQAERGEVTKGTISYRGERVQDLDPAALVKRVLKKMEVNSTYRVLIAHAANAEGARESRRERPLGGKANLAEAAGNEAGDGGGDGGRKKIVFRE